MKLLILLLGDAATLVAHELCNWKMSPGMSFYHLAQVQHTQHFILFPHLVSMHTRRYIYAIHRHCVQRQLVILLLGKVKTTGSTCIIYSYKDVFSAQCTLLSCSQSRLLSCGKEWSWGTTCVNSVWCVRNDNGLINTIVLYFYQALVPSKDILSPHFVKYAIYNDKGGCITEIIQRLPPS